MLELARGCAELLGLPLAPSPPTSTVGRTRARIPDSRSPEGAAAAELFAGTEGLLLDRVFTAKAAGVLIEMLRDGVDGPVVFVHTGGTATILDEEADA